MLSSPSFSISVLSSPLSSLGKFSSPASPRSRFHPSCATATATSCYYTCTEERRSVCVSPQRMALCASLYEILGIPIGATSQEIKTAYRRLARVCHPDVAATDRKDSSAGEFMKIHAAYCTLSDPEKRAVYDRRFLRPNRPLTVGISGFSGYRGRNWETDQCW